jgi:hypothetical protein
VLVRTQKLTFRYAFVQDPMLKFEVEPTKGCVDSIHTKLILQVRL